MEELHEPAGGLAPRTKNLRIVLGVRDQVPGGTVHRDVAVTFEETHHPLDRAERLQLLRRRESTDEPGLGKWVPAGPDVDSHASECFQHLAWVGRRDRDAAFDQVEKVSPQPRHSGELGTVSQFVQRDPEPELAGFEPVPTLQRDDVRPHVVHGVLR